MKKYGVLTDQAIAICKGSLSLDTFDAQVKALKLKCSRNTYVAARKSEVVLWENLEVIADCLSHALGRPVTANEIARSTDNQPDTAPYTDDLSCTINRIYSEQRPISNTSFLRPTNHQKAADILLQCVGKCSGAFGTSAELKQIGIETTRRDDRAWMAWFAAATSICPYSVLFTNTKIKGKTTAAGLVSVLPLSEDAGNEMCRGELDELDVTAQHLTVPATSFFIQIVASEPGLSLPERTKLGWSQVHTLFAQMAIMAPPLRKGVNPRVIMMKASPRNTKRAEKTKARTLDGVSMPKLGVGIMVFDNAPLLRLPYLIFRETLKRKQKAYVADRTLLFGGQHT